VSVLHNPDKNNYSQISNDLINDIRISALARFIYVYLYSKPDCWIIRNFDVQNNIGIKDKNTMSKYWRELVSSGWIERKKNGDGTFDYTVKQSLAQIRISKNAENNENDTQIWKNHNRVEPSYEKTLIGKNPNREKPYDISNTDLLSNTNEFKKTNINTISIKSASCQPKETKNNDECSFIDNSIADVDHGSCPDDDPFGEEVDIQKTYPLQDTQGTENNTLNLRFDEKTVSSTGNDDKASKNATSEKPTAKENNTTDSNTCMTFDEFWYMYGKKVEMKKCCQLYSKIKEADRQKIKDTLPKYVEATPDTQFRKYPATYLRNECWNDDLSAYQGTGFSNGRNNRDELKSEWADRVLGKVITKKASPETIEYFKHLDGPFGQLKTEN